MSSKEISDRLSKCFSSVIHDVMRDEGYKNFVLNPKIKPNKEKLTSFLGLGASLILISLLDILFNTFFEYFLSTLPNSNFGSKFVIS